MKVLIKGAGDLATGVACRLKRSGFSIVMTEIAVPTTVRRTVAFSRAIYEKEVRVEDIQAEFAQGLDDLERILACEKIAVIVDPHAQIMSQWKPDIVVDAILAKKNLGTHIEDAPIVIALGPGFTAQKDCHAVVETMRGHFLGKVYYEGSALPNTGIPGEIGGYTKERIIRAPAKGVFQPIVSIGDSVKQGDTVGFVDECPVQVQLSGIVRGLLQPGVFVTAGMKAGDVDPRCKREYCFSVSDKARSSGGGVLEAIVHQKQSNI